MPLTIDRMRADIAEMIHETPDAIGLDENLMDLGIDSMRLMNLILAWQEAGVALEFTDLAEYTTLAGWWGVVQQRQSASGAG